MSKSYTAIMKDLEALRYFPDILSRDKQAIQAEEMFADSYKARLIAKKQQEYEPLARDEARKVWQRAQRRVEQAKQDLERVINARDQGIDPNMVLLKSQEYAARIRNVAPGQSLPRVLASLADDARTPEAKRAFALAAADALNGPQAAELGRVRDKVKAWEAESEAVRHAAEVELQHAEAGVTVIRDAVLEAEQQVTGQRPSMWSITPWQSDILQESRESLGQVVWRDDTSEYMKQQVPTPPAPSGIED